MKSGESSNVPNCCSVVLWSNNGRHAAIVILAARGIKFRFPNPIYREFETAETADHRQAFYHGRGKGRRGAMFCLNEHSGGAGYNFLPTHYATGTKKMQGHTKPRRVGIEDS